MSIYEVDTIDDLKDVPATRAHGDLAIVKGYYSQFDSPVRVLRWHAGDEDTPADGGFVFDDERELGRWHETDKSVARGTQFGLIPGGNRIPNGELEDATDNIENLVRAAERHGLAIEFPSGSFTVSRTIRLGPRNGFTMRGQGFLNERTGAPRRGSNSAATIFVWAGGAGRPMFQGRVRAGLISDITFAGNADNQPSAGIWIASRTDGGAAAPGFGVGHLTFLNCSFVNCRSGALFGNTVENRNGADCWFYACQWVNCDACIQNTTSQNQNYVVRDGCCVDCTALCLARGGGLWYVDNCVFNNTPIVFDVPADTGNLAQPTGQFVAEKLKWDRQQTYRPVLLRDGRQDREGRRSARFSDIRVNESTWQNSPIGGTSLIDVGTGWSIKVENMSLLDTGKLLVNFASDSEGAWQKVIFCGCHLKGNRNPDDFINIAGSGSYKFVDCFDFETPQSHVNDFGAWNGDDRWQGIDFDNREVASEVDRDNDQVLVRDQDTRIAKTRIVNL